ncbi:MAG: methyltransferase domain-containing protein [Leptolyngbyaceae cyanobacterium CSU_1_3]|nr:methyltransferase domain-containing protein [Leptolyngbyaceae cyanobacterium CSU_1_3]
MAKSQYIFTSSQHSKELERLQAIEQVFDPASQRRIQSTGITESWRCLEVGAGAGSMTRWMAGAVGESGKVVAVDLDTRFITGINQSNVEVLEADVRNLSLEDSFNLIHTRYVLIHIPDFQVALTRLLKLLEPGGWLVLEEPDFSAARAIAGEKAACQSMNHVNQSILQMFENRGMDYALGSKLPAILQEFGLQQLCVENDVPLSNGGSGVATMMKMSALQLAEKYTATGKATEKDIEQYCLFADDERAWAIYYATVGVVAQKAAA